MHKDYRCWDWSSRPLQFPSNIPRDPWKLKLPRSQLEKTEVALEGVRWLIRDIEYTDMILYTKPPVCTCHATYNWVSRHPARGLDFGHECWSAGVLESEVWSLESGLPPVFSLFGHVRVRPKRKKNEQPASHSLSSQSVCITTPGCVRPKRKTASQPVALQLERATEEKESQPVALHCLDSSSLVDYGTPHIRSGFDLLGDDP
ncbi:hypothetical protein BZA05DRAFT_135892 [Tricharina praecox]|uniref:uncharacterized protein n=1 Tax=Tricharina praecox TaxID=43433 RepID=UPI00222071AA|nr:uncharacterized protein BZA05DRAFT_135892 [Tricharina praecox]KAI5846781.1 hypothetical protein BZA05DRAFT_135892 [Tricharina praecox]